jgi:hypothetical protein
MPALPIILIIATNEARRSNVMTIRRRTITSVKLRRRYTRDQRREVQAPEA